MPLTDIVCKNAKPKEKPYKLSDSGGLYLEVASNGGKYWRMKYRHGGKEKRLALGVYPTVPLSEAREGCAKAKKLLSEGIDPSLAKQQKKELIKLETENAFETIALEWYQKQVHMWTDHYAKHMKRRLELNIFPALGQRPIGDIEAPELLKAIRKIEERGSFDLAHRILQACGQIFRYGIATGRCKRDPSSDLRGALTPHKKKHQAAVKPEELPELMRAINTYESIGDRQTQLGLQLLSLTFVRTSELIGSQWTEFDFEKAIWIVPAERMKMKTEHVVPLANQAIEILKELKTLAAESPYVFPGRNPQRSISNNTLLFALYRLGYKGKMTGHGFRAVASTVLNETGFRPDVIERQLAHSERNEVRGAYNRAEYLPERKKMMQHWADYLNAVANGAKIVPFKVA